MYIFKEVSPPNYYRYVLKCVTFEIESLSSETLMVEAVDNVW